MTTAKCTTSDKRNHIIVHWTDEETLLGCGAKTASKQSSTKCSSNQFSAISTQGLNWCGYKSNCKMRPKTMMVVRDRKYALFYTVP